MEYIRKESLIDKLIDFANPTAGTQACSKNSSVLLSEILLL
jgi:hypothetical protein